MEIEVMSETRDYAVLEELVPFQGKLKAMTATTKEKLKGSIKKDGVIAPIFIWRSEGKSFIIDGHQRYEVLKELKAEGYHIPLLPVVVIPADSIEDAKTKLLAITSQYGEFEISELELWLRELGTYEFFEFGGVSLDLTMPDDVVSEEVYTANEHPTMAGNIYEQEDIESKEKEMEEKIQSRSERNYIVLLCPCCNRSFSFTGVDKGVKS